MCSNDAWAKVWNFLFTGLAQLARGTGGFLCGMITQRETQMLKSGGVVDPSLGFTCAIRHACRAGPVHNKEVAAEVGEQIGLRAMAERCCPRCPNPTRCEPIMMD